jgi:hypothetical protein
VKLKAVQFRSAGANAAGTPAAFAGLFCRIRLGFPDKVAVSSSFCAGQFHAVRPLTNDKFGAVIESVPTHFAASGNAPRSTSTANR